MDSVKIKSVRKLVDALGRERFESELGLNKNAVYNMIRNNKIPARLYVLTMRACLNAGVSAPGLDLFTFALGDENSQGDEAALSETGCSAESRNFPH